MVAIEATKASGGGIPADVVLAKLDAKLAGAKQRKAQRAG
jgi:hypothetical protein